MCPPTSFSDHRISASRKFVRSPKKTFSTASVISVGFAASLICPFFGASRTKCQTFSEVGDVPTAEVRRRAADNQLIGSPAERRAFTSASRWAASRIVCVFSQEVIVKSGRADKKRSAVCFASSGWPLC